MTPSKNAIAQAVKALHPNLTKKQFFASIRTPMCRLSTARYWEESYNILPWSRRTVEERDAALLEASKLVIP